MTGPLDPRGAWTADRCTIAKALDVVEHPLGVPDPARGLLRHHPVRRLRRARGHQRARRRAPACASWSTHGLLEREDYREPGQRTRQRYRLTEKGADLFPALVALMQWGDRWLDERGGPVELRHTDCGEPVGVELRCAAGHRVEPGELDLVSRRERS